MSRIDGGDGFAFERARLLAEEAARRAAEEAKKKAAEQAPASAERPAQADVMERESASRLFAPDAVEAPRVEARAQATSPAPSLPPPPASVITEARPATIGLPPHLDARDLDLDRQALAEALGARPAVQSVDARARILSAAAAAARATAEALPTAPALIGRVFRVAPLRFSEAAPRLLEGPLKAVIEKAGMLEKKAGFLQGVLEKVETRKALLRLGLDEAASHLQEASFHGGLVREVLSREGRVKGPGIGVFKAMVAARQELRGLGFAAGEAEEALLAARSERMRPALADLGGLEREAWGTERELRLVEAKSEALAGMEGAAFAEAPAEATAAEPAAAEPTAEEPGAFTEEDLRRLGSALDPSRPPPQTVWTEELVNTVSDLGRRQGGLTEEQGGRNAELARMALVSEGGADGPAQELQAADLAAILKMSGVDLAKVDPNQLHSATRYLGTATSLSDQREKLRKTLDNFQVLDKTGLPRLDRQQMVNQLWALAKVPGHALQKLSDAEIQKKFQEVAAALNGGPGQAQIKIGKHNLKLTVGENGQVSKSECKKPGFFSKLWSGIKKVAPIVLTVASFIPVTAPFARAIQAGISLVKAIKNKSILGIATAAAGIVGAGAAIARGAEKALGTVEKLANAASRGLHGVASLRRGSLIGGLASIGGAVAGGLGAVAKGAETSLGKFADRLNSVSTRLSAAATGAASLEAYRSAGRAVEQAKAALAEAQASGDQRAIALARRQLDQTERQKRSALIGGVAGSLSAASMWVGDRSLFAGESRQQSPARTRLESNLQLVSRGLGVAQGVASRDFASAAVSALSVGATVGSARRGGAPNTLNDAANLAQAGLGYYQASRAEAASGQAVQAAQARLEAARRSGDPEAIRQADQALKAARKEAEGALMGGMAAAESLLATAADIGQQRQARAEAAKLAEAWKTEAQAADRTAKDAAGVDGQLLARVKDTEAPLSQREAAAGALERLRAADQAFDEAAKAAAGDPAKLKAARETYEQAVRTAEAALTAPMAPARASAPATAPGRPEATPGHAAIMDPAKLGTVTIAKGMTLWEISQRTGVPVERIKEINAQLGQPIVNERKLQQGQVVVVPLGDEEVKFPPKSAEEVLAMQRAALAARQAAAAPAGGLSASEHAAFTAPLQQLKGGKLAEGMQALARLVDSGSPAQKMLARQMLGEIEAQHLQAVQHLNTERIGDVGKAVAEGTETSGFALLNPARNLMRMLGYDDNIRTIGNEMQARIQDHSNGLAAVQQIKRETGLTFYEIGRMPPAQIDEALSKAYPQADAAGIANLRGSILRSKGDTDVAALAKANYTPGSFSWERGTSRIDTSFADGLLMTASKAVGTTVRDARDYAEVMKTSSSFTVNFLGQFSASTLDAVSTVNRFTLDSIRTAQEFYTQQGGVLGKVGGGLTFAGSVLSSVVTAPLTLVDHRASDAERSQALVDTALWVAGGALARAAMPVVREATGVASRLGQRALQSELAASAAARLAGLGERAGVLASRAAASSAGQAASQAGRAVWYTGRRAADALMDSAAGRTLRAANDRILTPLAQYTSRTASTLGRTADAAKDYFNLVSNFGRGPILETGQRLIQNASLQAKHQAAKLYDGIRNSVDDVARIAKNTGLPEFQVGRIKDHVFQKLHDLRKGLSRFDPDLGIAQAWRRVEKGAFLPEDLRFLKHELFESKFGGIFKKDYFTAHDAAERFAQRMAAKPAGNPAWREVGRFPRELLSRGPEIPLVFRNPPPEASPTFLHNEYVNWVRPGATERVFKTPWAASRGLGTRRFDDYNRLTRTGFEGNTTPWSEMTQEQLSRKLGQVAADMVLLKTNAKVQRIIWFGTEPLPMTGLGAQLREALRQAGIPYFVVRP